jgi:hypothetical protein
MDDFKTGNKPDILNECTSQIWKDMLSLKALQVSKLIY